MRTINENDPRVSVEDRGFATPCWIWEQCRSAAGYGRTWTVERGNLFAHRLSYEQNVGPIDEGLDIDHLCRVKSCVNPDHLEAVSRSINLRRRPKCAALSVEDVVAIRASDESGVRLAKRFGVTRTTISHVRTRRTWAHV